MEFSKYIDETCLNPCATNKDIENICKQAIQYNFASVCVNPCNVSYAKKILNNSTVNICTVIGFPLGQNTTNIKKLEIIDALGLGATEFDVVINIGKIKEKDYNYVKEEIKTLREIAVEYILKIIIETCYLTEEEIKNMTVICSELNVDYIKTSTGYGSAGAKIKDIDIMNENKNNKLQIKASGGIKDLNFAKEMIRHGATRIGTSSGSKIMEEVKNETI